MYLTCTTNDGALVSGMAVFFAQHRDGPVARMLSIPVVKVINDREVIGKVSIKSSSGSLDPEAEIECSATRANHLDSFGSPSVVGCLLVICYQPR